MAPACAAGIPTIPAPALVHTIRFG
jgi:hypothetical protein